MDFKYWVQEVGRFKCTPQFNIRYARLLAGTGVEYALNLLNFISGEKTGVRSPGKQKMDILHVPSLYFSRVNINFEAKENNKGLRNRVGNSSSS